MLGFAGALMSNRLLSREMTRTVISGKVETPRSGGSVVDRYAYGFSDMLVDGVRIIGHNGGTPGYEAQLDIYPDLGYTVVILTNQDRVLLPAIRASEDILTSGEG